MIKLTPSSVEIARFEKWRAEFRKEGVRRCSWCKRLVTLYPKPGVIKKEG